MIRRSGEALLAYLDRSYLSIEGQKVRKGYCVTKAAGGNPAHFCSEAAVVSAELVE
ncbi:hypothetical protein [Sorangium sp. So ce426]|uniref:hypothetical protein n=1 Tax=unclassified Sorangium TaxID=2621164 RepID=UPI003F5B4FD3